jgi:tyrosine-protein phosphatase SIW14
MRVSISAARGWAVALGLAFVLAESVDARGSIAGIRIDNFGKVNDRYYRGAQPERSDYADLATLGVKTIVDLRDDAETYAKASAERAGLNYVVIPLSGWERPADDRVAKFLSVVNDPANQPVYVHCKVGKHRTGAMTAVYRMTQDNWSAADAYKEMQKYKFDSFFTPHTELKKFVFDYYTALQAAAQAATKEKGGG